MEVTAKLRYLRMSPKKVRLVADLVREMPVGEAVHQLTFSRKDAARPILKLLNSAVANAENNFKLNKEKLFIKKLTVDMGPALMRWRARAYGKAAPIRKKSSHISIVLDDIFTVNNAKHRKRLYKSIAEKVVMDSLPKNVKLKIGNKKVEIKKKFDKGTKNVTSENRADIVDTRRMGKHRHTEHQDATSKKISEDKKVKDIEK